MVGTGSYTGLVAEPSACRTEVPSVVSVLTTVIFILVAQFGFEPVHRLCYLGECLPSLGLGFFCLSARCRKPLSVPSMLLLELSPDKMYPIGGMTWCPCHTWPDSCRCLLQYLVTVWERLLS